MTEPLTVDVGIRRFEVWRGAVFGVAAAAIAALAAWAALTSRAAAPAAWAGHVLLIGAAGVLAVIVLARGLIGVAGGRLQMHAGRWTFAPEDGSRSQAEAGRVAVAIDVGSFLLLRFVADGHEAGRNVRWLPIQRRGLERDWHALRCAVYSPPLVVPRGRAADASFPE